MPKDKKDNSDTQINLQEMFQFLFETNNEYLKRRDMPQYHYNHRKPHRKTLIRVQHILHFMALGKSDEWIARHIKATVKTVKQYRCRDYFWKEYERIKDRLPGKIKYTRNFTEHELNGIKKLNQHGFTNGQIARRLGCSPQRIHYTIKRLGLTANGKIPGPYTEAEIKEMLRLRVDEKMSYADIAKITGRSRYHIFRVLKRHTFESMLKIPRNQLKKAK